MKKLLICLFLLSACTYKPLETPINENNITIIQEDTTLIEPIEKHMMNSQFEKWGDTIAGVYLLGYGDYNTFDDITSSPEFHLILNLYPDINAFNKVQTNQGEVILMIISRYEDTHISIKTTDGETLEEENNFDAILLRTNESELRSETSITITHQDKEVIFEPFVSMMDGRLELPKEILDLTPINYPRDLLHGIWNNKNMEILFYENGTMIFHIFKNNIVYEGHYYYNGPKDYAEPFDDADGTIYFYLSADTKRFQLFSKYFYSIHDDTLYLKHLTYDPVLNNTENKLYTLTKEGE